MQKTINKYYPKSKIVILNKNTEGQASTCEKGLENEDLNKEVLIGTCDSSIIYNDKKYKKLLRDKRNKAIVFSFRNSINVLNKPDDYAFLKINKNYSVKDVSEKKKISKTPHKDHEIVGIFYFRKLKYFFEGINLLYNKNYRIKKEFYIDSIIKFLAKKNYKIKAFEVDYYIGWGTPNDLKIYKYWNEYFLKR